MLLLTMTILPTIAVAIVLTINKFQPELVRKHLLKSGIAVVFITLMIGLIPLFLQLLRVLGSDRLGVKTSILWGLIICGTLFCVSAHFGSRTDHTEGTNSKPFIIWCGVVASLTYMAWATMFTAQTVMASIGPMGGSFAMLDQSNWVHSCVLFGMAGFTLGSFVEGKKGSNS